ncbi:MAG: hypothetical protein IPM29_26910 [Planctomycetes bacterium]|nr:hypothetical protein [Planctomycetota bacterium]
MGSGLWRADGTAASAQLAVDVWAGTVDSSPRPMTPCGASLLLSAALQGTGRGPIVTDGRRPAPGC